MEVRIHRFLPVTTVEGPGKRACLWVQGCSINCKGCGVPWTWSASGGQAATVDTLYQEIKKSYEQHGIEGVTFLGGEPFDQAVPLAELGKRVKVLGLSVMTFTGYTFEAIQDTPRAGWENLVSITDLLITGPFIKEELDLNRPWIGSSNQQYHFLTSRYGDLEQTLPTIPNRLEIRLGADGQVMINGMAPPDTMENLAKEMVRKRN
jgi:anaerobic ribonucleoside-triphosphate reductase activating protein